MGASKFSLFSNFLNVTHLIFFTGNVRIQWDPDQYPKGESQRRRAVQLGIKGRILQRFHEQYIQHIEDITEFVKEQRQHVLKNELDKLLTPAERVYTPSEKEVCRHILLDEFHDSKEESRENNSVGDEVSSSERDAANNKIAHDREDPQNDISSKVDGVDCSEVLDTGLQGMPDSRTMQAQAVVSTGLEGAFCAELLTSVSQNATAIDDKKENVIVCLGGAFNPVHTRHVDVIETAMQWLEDNTNYHVIGGRLAVASDGYVKSKCRRTGELCMKAEHRIKLCELTCVGHEMIKPYHKTVGSAMDCGQRVKWEDNLKNTRIGVLVGADRAMSKSGQKKWKTKNKCITICVGRKGKTDEIKKAYGEDCKHDLVTNANFFIVDKELDNVSSTEIRRELRQAGESLRTQQNSGIAKDNLDNEKDTRNFVKYLKAEQLVSDKIDEKLKNRDSNSDGSDNYSTSADKNSTKTENDATNTDDDATNTDNDATNPAHRAATVTEGGFVIRKQVVKELVKKGWIVESAGQYILDNFTELYL